MEEPEFQYDVFLSHAGEDKEWSEQLAERLRNQGVRVWFDKWEMKPGDHLLNRLNEGLKHSRKLVAVWSPNYFKDNKTWTLAEGYARQQGDVLARERPIIPILRERCEIPPLFCNVIYLDFQNPHDFDLRFRQLLESLDLPKANFEQRYDETTDKWSLPVHGATERGRLAQKAGERFEIEVAALYQLLGFEVKRDTQLSGVQIDLLIEKREGGFLVQAIVECKDKKITSVERDQILAQQNVAQKKLPRLRWIAISSVGFAADTRTALEEAGIDCTVYADLLRNLVPLDSYIQGLITDYENWVNDKQNWDGCDLFIRPDLVTDIIYERQSALTHLGKWLGDDHSNFLVVLGDLGTGKTRLASFLAYQLARSFRDDPLRHPAPVLIPLRDVRKEVSLDSIVIKHFRDRGILGLNFQRFEHLVRHGKIILFFDAFDEMADRIRSDITQSNFTELRRAVGLGGKAILTCRTHYFKDRQEQSRLIGEGPSLTEAETALYKELRQQSNAEVVYLQEFNEEQIKAYLQKARGNNAAADWERIQNIYNLRDLAQRPLLLEMIVKTLPKLKPGVDVNASSLYKVYTNLWVERDYTKGRVVLTRDTKLALMMELASWMWRDKSLSIKTPDLIAFVSRLHSAKAIEFGDEEIEDIVREVEAASFLRRDHDGSFSFMHRSFGEFFFARKILGCLGPTVSAGKPTAARMRDGQAKLRSVLDTHRIERKVIYFLARLDEADALLAPLQAILASPYRENVSENALQILYWSGRGRCEMDEKVENLDKLRQSLANRIPDAAQLAGAKLQEVILEGARLVDVNLRGADMTMANLNNAALMRVDLSGSTLKQARLENTHLQFVEFKNADLTGFVVTGAQFIESEVGQAASVDRMALASAQVATKLSPGWGYMLVREKLQPVVQLGSPLAVTCVAWDVSGHLVAAGGGDGIIRLYRTDGRLLRIFEGHRGPVYSIAFDLSGRTLASASDDKTVKLWDTTSGKRLRTLEGHHSLVYSVAFDPPGRTLASASDDNTVKLWKLVNGELLRSLEGRQNWVRSVAFDPSGRTLAIGSSYETVKLWDATDGQLLRTLEGHQSSVQSVAFDPSGRKLASASYDKTVKLWDFANGKLLRTLEGHQNWVRSVAFDPSGRTLASASNDTTVKLWESASGKLLRTLEGHQHWILSVAFDPSGRTLASAGDDETAKLWDFANGKLLRTLEGHKSSVNNIAFDASGRTLASAGDDETVKLWDSAGGKLLRTLRGHRSSVNSIAFNASGQTLASASDDKTVKLWDSASGKLLRTLEGHQTWVRSAAFDASGGTLASASDDKTVKIWEAASGKLLHTLEGHETWVRSVTFNASGGTLASASNDSTVKLWEVASGRLLRTLEGHLGPISSVVFDPKSRYLIAAGSAGRLQFWDLEKCETFLYLYSFGPGSWLSLLPDGRFDGTQDALRYLCYTEEGLTNSFTAEELVKEFHDPKAVQAVLQRYNVAA